MNKEKSETSKIIGAGITGAVIGAASAAAASYLSKRENREKVKQTFHDIKLKGEEKLHALQGKSEDIKDEAEEKFEETKSVADEITNKTRTKTKDIKEKIEEEGEKL